MLVWILTQWNHGKEKHPTKLLCRVIMAWCCKHSFGMDNEHEDKDKDEDKGGGEKRGGGKRGERGERGDKKMNTCTICM